MVERALARSSEAPLSAREAAPLVERASLTPISARYPGAAVLDEVGFGLAILDRDGDVAATNAIADGLLRRRAGEVSLLAALRERARAEGPAGQELIEVVNEAGQRSLVGFRLARSEELGTVITLRDITELERARVERQTLERLSQVGRACAMVAHEIGNPLAAIKATLQSVEREAAAAGLGDTIGAVFREIDRLDKILGQLLGFVRHRAPRAVRADLGAIVERARLAAGARLARARFHGPPSPLPPVLCDPDQMEQVFLNLFLNAADAMPNGGDLLVRAAPHGDRLVIRVEDGGTGVPPSLREKVFESFYTTKPLGVGLGLSVCYRIMSDHNGSISIEDRAGEKGTSVRLVLPLAPAASLATHSQGSAPPVPARSG
jgi:signal transduction histidine kinase